MIPLSLLVGPAVGAVIGYLTNYLAVKMLFRPYTEKRIGALALPFTPGVIPRRRDELARALGDAVGKRLVTRQDLASVLVSNESVDALTEKLLTVTAKEGGRSLGERLGELMGSEQSLTARNRVNGAIAEAITEALSAAKLGELLLREGATALREANPMLGMFLGDALIEQLSPAVDESVKRYLAERGQSELLSAVALRSDALLDRDAASLLAEIGLDAAAQRSLLKEILRRLLDACLPTLLDRIDLSDITAQKIREMEMRELEALVLSVMRRELRAVVNLGAVIGFALGFLTAVF